VTDHLQVETDHLQVYLTEAVSIVQRWTWGQGVTRGEKSPTATLYVSFHSRTCVCELPEPQNRDFLGDQRTGDKQEKSETRPNYNEPQIISMSCGWVKPRNFGTSQWHHKTCEKRYLSRTCRHHQRGSSFIHSFLQQPFSPAPISLLERSEHTTAVLAKLTNHMQLSYPFTERDKVGAIWNATNLRKVTTGLLSSIWVPLARASFTTLETSVQIPCPANCTFSCSVDLKCNETDPKFSSKERGTECGEKKLPLCKPQKHASHPTEVQALAWENKLN
jgi:hypothetical protein